MRADTLVRVRFGVPAGLSAQIATVEALCQILGAQRAGEDLPCVDLGRLDSLYAADRKEFRHVTIVSARLEVLRKRISPLILTYH